MPSLEGDNHGVAAVAAFAGLLEELLDRATKIKPTASIEPALTKADFGELSKPLSTLSAEYQPLGEGEDGAKNSRQFAIIETAVRDLFGELIATTPIESPDFVKIWHLFDLISILSDDEQCEPALLFWLVEELLDSQTISGCRIIFDFLESRRETIIRKHFKQKNLVILRMCNELLRRLSRAEDTAFCGRVFIFLFQSFPLGDKSSVNLRGEYHVENVTTYDRTVGSASQDATGKMDVDVEAHKEADDSKAAPRGVTFDAQKQPGAEKPLDADTLYPMFWSLQESFCQPKKLFDPGHLSQFKVGLEATMNAFIKIQEEQRLRPSKATDESKRGAKRKQPDGPVESTNAFAHKYLTSRDLFELEISDESFRRYVLIQALIIMDFLLSTCAKSKEKLTSSSVPNKSVAYLDQTLGEEDTKWATEMKKKIEHHITRESGPEGAYFYRMVETILNRDRHWVRWKVDNCPPIEQPPVAADGFMESKKTLHRITASKRARNNPMGSLSLNFLNDSDEQALLERLKGTHRYQLPDLQTLQDKIADDDFDIDRAQDARSKALATDRKFSKSWRALRIASMTRLPQFDKIDNPDKIDAIFDEVVEGDDQDMDDGAVNSEDIPSDIRPIIISGPVGAGKTTLASALMERRRGVFARVVQHTSRAKREEETEGKDFHFVTSQAFNIMLDGDQFIEFQNFDGYDTGTNRKTVEAISDGGRVPLLEMTREAVKMTKDMGFDARFVLIKPPSTETLANRAKEGGMDETAAQELAKAGEEEMNDVETEKLFDIVITNDDLKTAVKVFEEHIYGVAEPASAVNGTTDEDREMADVPEQG